jgi:hypothetical protein
MYVVIDIYSSKFVVAKQGLSFWEELIEISGKKYEDGK